MADDVKDAKAKKPKKPRGKARLLEGKCIACGARCQAECPTDAVTMNEKGEPIIELETCIGCRKCVKICPSVALEMYFTPEELALLEQLKAAGLVKEEKEKEEAEPQADPSYQGVWVFVEQVDGAAATVSWELLGVGSFPRTRESRGLGQGLDARPFDRLRACFAGMTVAPRADE